MKDRVPFPCYDRQACDVPPRAPVVRDDTGRDNNVPRESQGKILQDDRNVHRDRIHSVDNCVQTRQARDLSQYFVKRSFVIR